MSDAIRELRPLDIQVELLSGYSRTKSPGLRIEPHWVDTRDEARLVLTTMQDEEVYLTWGGDGSSELLLDEQEFLNYAVELSQYINAVMYRDGDPTRIARVYFEYAPFEDHDQIRSITRVIQPTVFERVMEQEPVDPVYICRPV